MTTVHDFEEQLEWSEAASYEPFWQTVYKKAFPNMINHMVCSGDTYGQRMGVDRVIYLSNNTTISIDEKKRREVYPDVLLEYISVDTTGAPGWIEKDLAIDYLAYAFVPTKQCYLYPWLLLRRAWIHYKEEWLDNGRRKRHGFRLVTAQNPGYQTHSVAVPRTIIQAAIRNALLIDVSKELPNWTPE